MKSPENIMGKLVPYPDLKETREYKKALEALSQAEDVPVSHVIRGFVWDFIASPSFDCDEFAALNAARARPGRLWGRGEARSEYLSRVMDSVPTNCAFKELAAQYKITCPELLRYIIRKNL